MRAPLNVVDQLVFHLDQVDEPWSVHCEVRVPGGLDPDRLAAAASGAAARHPLARARLAPFRPYDRQLFWEIADRVDRVPLQVLDCPDDAALDRARSQLLSQRVDLQMAPPFALALARGPRGDSLILNLNHVAGDGISSVRLMTSIARAYAGAEDPVPELDPLEARLLREHLGPREGRDRDRPRVRPARVAVRGGLGGELGFGFHLVALEPEQAAALNARRRPPATFNDLLIASLAVAISRFNGASAGAPIAVATPVNLRPADRPLEIVSNIFFSASVVIGPEAESDLDAAQLAVAERTRVFKERREQGGIIPEGSGRLPVSVLHVAARMLRGLAAPRADTAVLSNLGRLPAALDFGPDAGAATELWFSPPVRMPLGIAVGVATVENRVFLTIRYCRAQFDATGAAAFAGVWRDLLLVR